MNQLSQICPITDAEAERLVRPATLADLAARITAEPAPAAGHRRARQRARYRWPSGARLAAAVAVVLLAVTVLVTTRLLGPGRPAGSASPSARASTPRETTARVLSFTTSDGYITVIVRNPLADPRRYRAELAAHHLNITLELVPASPSLVGTVVYIGEPSGGPDLQTITAQGRCYTGGGGAACPVGVRIPVGFRGQAEVVFGRAARPGEHYESTADATAPGEVMHGMSYVGDTVARVLAMLAQRHVTVPVFNETRNGYASNVAHVPGTWYVYDAVPWAPGQVMLVVGPTRTQPPAQAPQPGSPVASPTSQTPQGSSASSLAATSVRSSPTTSGRANGAPNPPVLRVTKPVVSPARLAPWQSQSWAATSAIRSGGTPMTSAAYR
jgi:hypothetical protein